MKKINSSCDPKIEHIIFNCNEVVTIADDVYCKLVYVSKEGYEGKVIGVNICDKFGTFADNGLILTLENGVWIRHEIDNEYGEVFSIDDTNKIKVIP